VMAAVKQVHRITHKSNTCEQIKQTASLVEQYWCTRRKQNASFRSVGDVVSLILRRTQQYVPARTGVNFQKVKCKNGKMFNS